MNSNHLYINGDLINIGDIELDSYSVLQHCELSSIDIPRFCYHDQLSIAGNCRMCVIEILDVTKPVISCATEISKGMEVFTNTVMVKQAREYILEFLLLNHPLDCPICDQGGECDLQDLTLVYGSDASRFVYNKRTVSDKNFGPLVKSIMTRCIHCTRCIRFFDEIVGNSLYGMLGRGSNSEIGSYAYDNEQNSYKDNLMWFSRTYSIYDYRFIILYEQYGYSVISQSLFIRSSILLHFIHWLAFIQTYFFLLQKSIFKGSIFKFPSSKYVKKHNWIKSIKRLTLVSWREMIYISIWECLCHLHNISYVSEVDPYLITLSNYCPATTEWEYYKRKRSSSSNVSKLKYRVLKQNSVFLLKYNFKHSKKSYIFNGYAWGTYYSKLYTYRQFGFVPYNLKLLLEKVIFITYRNTIDSGDAFTQPIYDTEIIGNVIDLCPVGALTSRPYSFTSRPWELVSTESIDILDSLCSNIRIDSRGSELLRVLPRLNPFINNEWITDKIRFSYIGLKQDRILTPLCRGVDFNENDFWWVWTNGLNRLSRKKLNKHFGTEKRINILRFFSEFIEESDLDTDSLDLYYNSGIIRPVALHGHYSYTRLKYSFLSDVVDRNSIMQYYKWRSRLLHHCSWEKAFNLFRASLLSWFGSPEYSNSTYFFAGHLVDMESTYYFKLFCNALGISNVNLHINLNTDFRLNYVLNKSISSLFNDSNLFMFLSTNLKLESPILNIRSKSNNASRSIRIGYIGTHVKLNYPYLHLGLSSMWVTFFYYGKSYFSYNLDYVECFMGTISSQSIPSILKSLSSSIFSFNYISLYSGDLNICELSALSTYNVRTNYAKKFSCKFLFSLGADYMSHQYAYNDVFSVYVGHNYEEQSGAPYSILPSSSFVEKDGLYLNCQGKLQSTGQAISPAGFSWTNELIMYSLLRFTVEFRTNKYLFDYSFNHYFHSFKKYIPSRLEYINSFFTIDTMNCSYYYKLILFVSIFRIYYESDIISRSNKFFFLCKDVRNKMLNNYL